MEASQRKIGREREQCVNRVFKHSRIYANGADEYAQYAHVCGLYADYIRKYDRLIFFVFGETLRVNDEV